MARAVQKRKRGARSGARVISSNPREGSTLDDFLREQGIYEEATTRAIKETIAWQVAHVMEERRLTKTEMASRMDTSRAALDRLLDPKNDSVTLATLLRAADALGMRLQVTLREPEQLRKHGVSAKPRSRRR